MEECWFRSRGRTMGVPSAPRQMHGIVVLLVLLSCVITEVQSQADGPATCVRTWQLTGTEDLLQACQEPSSAVNVVASNQNLLNVFGGGGQYQLIEGRDTVDEDVIVPLLESYGRASILAMVIEDNKQGTIDVQQNTVGPNTNCRDNTSGNNLVTVAATTITGTANAYGNGGIVILSLHRNSGGTVTGQRVRRKIRRKLLNVGQTKSDDDLAKREELEEMFQGEYEDEVLEEGVSAHIDINYDELPESVRRKLQVCDENAPGFESICWWMYLLRQAGRPDGTLTCESDFACEPLPCPPINTQPPTAPTAPTSRKPSPDKPTQACDIECCLRKITRGPGIKRRCNCGLFVRGDTCYWEVAKDECFTKPSFRPGEGRNNYRKRVKKAKNKFRRGIKRAYKEWCKDEVEDGKFTMMSGLMR